MATRVKTGRPPYFSVEEEGLLLQLADAHPHSTLPELAKQFVEVHAPGRKPASVMTVMRVLKRHGYTHYRRPEPPKPSSDMPREPDWPRYQSTHRQYPDDGYPSDLTDEQWALVAPLLERPGHRGPRPREPRQTLNGILYVLRTGCQWRQLPREFGKWNSVAKTFYRWRDSGLIEQLHDTLNDRERSRVDRAPSPTMLLLDSQSAKTSEKGGLEATTPARR